MPIRRAHAAATSFLVAIGCVSSTLARELTFEDRVRAQEAIERVQYTHQVGATKPFEQAVSESALEAKVTRYLKQSAALEVYWHTPVTDEMLRREVLRQATRTRMPDRLRELYRTLDDDPLLVAECLARPALVDRSSERGRRRPLRSAERFVERRLLDRTAAEALRSFGRVDRKPDDRLGRDHSGSREHRRSVRPGDRHVDGDVDGRRPVEALRPTRGMDRKPDDRLGRSQER